MNFFSAIFLPRRAHMTGAVTLTVRSCFGAELLTELKLMALMPSVSRTHVTADKGESTGLQPNVCVHKQQTC